MAIISDQGHDCLVLYRNENYLKYRSNPTVHFVWKNNQKKEKGISVADKSL